MSIMSKHIIEDAKRCLQCKNPMCSQGCPVHTPIRDAISLLLDSKISDAGRLLFENNPLSLVCCHVCPQENQCEGHCVLGKKGDQRHRTLYIRLLSEHIQAGALRQEQRQDCHHRLGARRHHHRL